MLSVRMNSMRAGKILKNAVVFSSSFVDGITLEEARMNERLAKFTIDSLYKYVDAQARMSPSELHHVYEWNMVGNPRGRLFEMDASTSNNGILISGRFLKSKRKAEGASEPFSNKAEVMENAIGVTISPNNSPVLVFEDGGETIFTTESIYIAHPGGDDVAGSFGKIVEEFFDSYFKNVLLQPLIKDLETADEFGQGFSKGVRGGARSAGIAAGKKYLSLDSLGEII